jgi:hypothetical protein
MTVQKKVIGNLEKCYSLAPLRYNNAAHFLVAAEKVERCLLFDLDGNLEETIWAEPGGTMSMVQAPGSNGVFLATQRFYSPNDSADASIVVVTPRAKNDWQVRTLVKLPFVHRFDILCRNGVQYLIACALKSGHSHNDDWSSPGKVYAAVLPPNLDAIDERHPLNLVVLMDGLFKNHGYYRQADNGLETAVISSEQGVCRYTPPETADALWRIDTLITEPASDALLLDIDGDGENELAVLSPFHGDTLSIYKKKDGVFVKIYTHPQKLEFLHALFGGALGGANGSAVCAPHTLIIGHRKGDKALLAFTGNKTGGYTVETLDTGRGPANILHYVHNGRDILIAANRETDEIAMYTLKPED